MVILFRHTEYVPKFWWSLLPFVVDQTKPITHFEIASRTSTLNFSIDWLSACSSFKIRIFSDENIFEKLRNEWENSVKPDWTVSGRIIVEKITHHHHLGTQEWSKSDCTYYECIACKIATAVLLPPARQIHFRSSGCYLLNDEFITSPKPKWLYCRIF